MGNGSNENSTIERLKEENAKLKASNRAFARHDYLVRLLRGGYSDIPDVDSIGRDCGITFSQSAFVLLFVHIEDINQHFLESGDDSRPGKIFKMVGELARSLFLPVGSIYEVAMGFDIAVIVCGSSKARLCKENVLSISRKLVDGILSMGVISWLVASDICLGIEALSDSWTRISELGGYRQAMGLSQDVAFAGDYSVDVLRRLPGEAMAENELPIIVRILDCVRNDKYTDAAKALVELTDSILNGHTPSAESYQLQYYGFQYLIFVCSDAIKHKYPQCPISFQLRPELLFKNRSFIEASAAMVTVFHQIEEYLCTKKVDAGSPAWVSSVYSEISDNFRNINLNISTIAVGFGMNPAYMSRAFKKHTGNEISELINTLRLKEAKRLILAGASIEAAALESGFGSSVTLRRNFKKYEGCVPSRIESKPD